MPVLPICDADGRPHWSDLPNIFALMLFPKDQELRCSYLARAKMLIQARHADYHGSKLVVEPEMLLTGLQGKASAVLWPQVKRRTREGSLAGTLLEITLALAENYPKHASLRKAAFVFEYRLAETGQKGVTSQITAAWARFHTVAHLWAAYNVRRNRFDRAFFIHEDVGYTADVDVHAFITEAEIYRRRGIEHFPLPNRSDARPLLDPKQTWRPPGNWHSVRTEEHQEWPPTGRVYLSTPEEWIERALEAYKRR